MCVDVNGLQVYDFGDDDCGDFCEVCVLCY